MGICYSQFDDKNKRKYYVNWDSEYITPLEVRRFETNVAHETSDNDYVSFGELTHLRSSSTEPGIEPADFVDPNQDDETGPKVAGPSPCPGPQHGSLASRIRTNRHRIERLINAEEILPHLHFIDNCDLASKRGLCQREKAHFLLDAISRNNRDDKWKIFLSALERLDYSYLVDILTGRSVEDHIHLESILRRVGAEIVGRAHVSDVIHQLYQSRVLNQEDMEQITRIKASEGPMPACRLMLSMVPRRSRNWYDILEETLRGNGMKDIAETMKEHEMEIMVGESLNGRTLYEVNTATAHHNEKVYNKLPMERVYDEAHSDITRLRYIRQESRNVVHNLKCKRQLTDVEMSLIEDLKEILQELQFDNSSTQADSCTTADSPGDSGISLQVDTTDNNQHQTTQVVINKPTHVTVKLNDKNVHDVLRDINGRCREIEEKMSRSQQSISDLTGLVSKRLQEGESCHNCQVHLSSGFSDSAIFSISDSDYSTQF